MKTAHFANAQCKLHFSNTSKGFSAKREPKGFTLVELLVAITIVAILSAVGIVVFSGVQAKARDARRSQDLDAIAAALEGKKQAGSIYYKGLIGGDFSGGAIPADPKSATQTYCLWGKTDVPPVAPITKPALDAVIWTTCTGPIADYTAVVAASVPTDDTKVTSWTICAKLEAGSVECRYSKL